MFKAGLICFPLIASALKMCMRSYNCLLVIANFRIKVNSFLFIQHQLEFQLLCRISATPLHHQLLPRLRHRGAPFYLLRGKTSGDCKAD